MADAGCGNISLPFVKKIFLDDSLLPDAENRHYVVYVNPSKMYTMADFKKRVKSLLNISNHVVCSVSFENNDCILFDNETIEALKLLPEVKISAPSNNSNFIVPGTLVESQGNEERNEVEILWPRGQNSLECDSFVNNLQQMTVSTPTVESQNKFKTPIPAPGFRKHRPPSVPTLSVGALLNTLRSTMANKSSVEPSCENHADDLPPAPLKRKRVRKHKKRNIINETPTPNTPAQFTFANHYEEVSAPKHVRFNDDNSVSDSNEQEEHSKEIATEHSIPGSEPRDYFDTISQARETACTAKQRTSKVRVVKDENSPAFRKNLPPHNKAFSVGNLLAGLRSENDKPVAETRQDMSTTDNDDQTQDSQQRHNHKRLRKHKKRILDESDPVNPPGTGSTGYYVKGDEELIYAPRDAVTVVDIEGPVEDVDRSQVLEEPTGGITAADGGLEPMELNQEGSQATQEYSMPSAGDTAAASGLDALLALRVVHGGPPVFFSKSRQLIA